MTAILLQLPTHTELSNLSLFLTVLMLVFGVLLALAVAFSWLVDRFISEPLTTQPKRLELERRHLDVIVMGKR